VKNYYNADYHSCSNCGNQENFIELIDGKPCICENCNTIMDAVHSELLLDESRGIYIPRDFLENFDLDQWHIDKELKEYSSPDHEYYWDNWHDVLNKAYCVLDNVKYHLDHDGSLFARAYIEFNESEV
jgi:hypothetical protein